MHDTPHSTCAHSMTVAVRAKEQHSTHTQSCVISPFMPPKQTRSPIHQDHLPSLPLPPLPNPTRDNLSHPVASQSKHLNCETILIPVVHAYRKPHQRQSKPRRSQGCATARWVQSQIPYLGTRLGVNVLQSMVTVAPVHSRVYTKWADSEYGPIGTP